VRRSSASQADKESRSRSYASRTYESRFNACLAAEIAFAFESKSDCKESQRVVISFKSEPSTRTLDVAAGPFARSPNIVRIAPGCDSLCCCACISANCLIISSR